MPNFFFDEASEDEAFDLHMRLKRHVHGRLVAMREKKPWRDPDDAWLNALRECPGEEDK